MPNSKVLPSFVEWEECHFPLLKKRSVLNMNFSMSNGRLQGEIPWKKQKGFYESLPLVGAVTTTYVASGAFGLSLE